MSEKIIYLMRHGHIDTGGVKRYIGRKDVPLSPIGREQARQWQKTFADMPPEHVWSSSLSRTRETAGIIAEPLGMIPRPVKELDETDIGEWEGLAFEDVRSRWPDAYRLRGENPADFHPPGGESFLDLAHRAVPAFMSIVESTEVRALIVAHAGVNRIILCHVLGMPVANLFRLSQDFAAVTIIAFHNSQPRILCLNMQASAFSGACCGG